MEEKKKKKSITRAFLVGWLRTRQTQKMKNKEEKERESRKTGRRGK